MPKPKRKRSTIPDSLTTAVAWAYDQGVRLGYQAQQGNLKPQRARAIRGALKLLGKLRDAAAIAQASGLADWKAVRRKKSPPTDPIEKSLWVVWRACQIIERAQAGEMEDEETFEHTMEALKNYDAAVSVEPLESRVKAWRELKEGRHIESEARGPTPSKRGPRSSLRA